VKRLLGKATVCAGLVACMMFGGIGSASALDGWSTLSQHVNNATGTSKCTIGASTPVNQANLVAGSGSINCNEPYMRIELTICIQTKQPLLDDATWQDAGCAPPKVVENSPGTSNTHKIQCLPGQMLYRTQTHAVGFKENDTQNDPGFNLLIHGSSAAFNCFS
jgi:hypothetical protein